VSGVGAGTSARSGYNSPVEPSSRSRSRSACPLGRAYSSIMWVSTQRRDTWPLRRNPRTSSDGAAATSSLAWSHSARQRRNASAGPAVATSRNAASQSISGAKIVAIGSPPSTGRNQFRSTSAMCLTMPSRDRLDGGTARSRSWSSVSPSHLRARVARCQSRNAVSVARSSASRGGTVRGEVMVPLFRLRRTGSGRTGDGIHRSCRPRARVRRCSPGGTRGAPPRARPRRPGRRARGAAGHPARAG
jgi:hypothetical protein